MPVMTKVPDEIPETNAPPEFNDAMQAALVPTHIRYYTQHPISAAFPTMSDIEFTALVENIRNCGQYAPITVYEDQILDGWHRYRACRTLGKEPATVEFTGTTEQAAEFAFSLNARRRHLKSGQLALLAVNLLPQFAAAARAPHRASIDAARVVGVSPSSVERAHRVLTYGTAEEIAAVRDGSRGLGPVAKAVQQRINATRTAPKPSSTEAVSPQRITPTTALTLIPEPAALTLPDAGMIAALKALNEGLREHIAGWLGDPEFLLGTLRAWTLVARGHLDPHGSLEWRYMPSYDVETLTVRLPGEPLG
jgi:hypothetical protein